MLSQTALRFLAALILSGLGWGLWLVLGRRMIHQAHSFGRSAGHPAGFVPGNPGLLVFSSPDCRTCVSAQKPALRSLVARLGQGVQILDVDVSLRPELAERYGVLSLPTIFVLDKTGEPKRVNHGFVPSAELERQLAPYLLA